MKNERATDDAMVLISFRDRDPAGSATFDLRREAARRRPHVGRLQHPKGVHASLGVASPRWHANLRQDAHGQDDHARSRVLGHDRERQGEDPGQGGHPARPAASDLRRASSSRTAARCRTTTSRRSPRFTWCCVSEVVCKSSSRRSRARRSRSRSSPRTRSTTSRRRSRTRRASRRTSSV